MKILKKPKIKPTTCENCGCIYQAKIKKMVNGVFTTYKERARCPFCQKLNNVQFEKESDDA